MCDYSRWSKISDAVCVPTVSVLRVGDLAVSACAVSVCVAIVLSVGVPLSSRLRTCAVMCSTSIASSHS